MRGFYPGVAAPRGVAPQIAAGTQLDRIGDGEEAGEGVPREVEGDREYTLKGKKMIMRRGVARVVGSFDHPVLPMPPVRVCLSFCFCCLR